MDNIYWIKGPWSGRLAIIARPRGDDWLEDEIKQWQRAGIDMVVSLLTPREVHELGLSEEAALSKKQAIDFLTFPIPDRGIPSSRPEMQTVVATLLMWLQQGKTIGIHCRHGIGRSALLAASLLVNAGIDADRAFHQIERARGVAVPDTPAQKEWVEKFATTAAMPTLDHSI
ncbi:MAG: dual specificity protein phosphatase family protein [Caldilineaceae bacterium]